MDATRQQTQYCLAFEAKSRGEAPRVGGEGTESSMAKNDPESLASSAHLMEVIVERENVMKALQRVKANRGGPGVDGMTVEQLPVYLRTHWLAIRNHLLGGTYEPDPVKRVEIPKASGGVRKLGIPTVLDRFIQQAMLQALQGIWDGTFSEHSYGFRPGRSAHQAVAQAQRYVAAGYRYVVDIDLEKFFDRVNHDRLMGRVAKRITDKRVLKLIRGFLNAGVLEDGLVNSTDEGTPQGGPLSPLLSNIVLDDLDRELERRGHRFVRYADDCNVYVRSRRAGDRVMASVKRFITRRLKLKVNKSKSAVGRPGGRKFLSFLLSGHEPKRRIAPEAIERLKKRVRELTSRTRGVSIERMVKELGRYLRGWRGYFGICESRSVLGRLDQWTRRRIRSVAWRQWRTGRQRYVRLRQGGVGCKLAAQTASSSHGS